uniref:RING-CH-type domain-containing protein n=2 Tax=Timema TaxID=61471 RepID=A0A7R9B1P2_TIMSH|nr:unnamed protein product [Timema shepardi]
MKRSPKKQSMMQQHVPIEESRKALIGPTELARLEGVRTCGSRMEGVIKLTSQNPLSLLVKFGIMAAWNATCAENCSGHGECHNGTCLCEIQFDGDECHTPNLSYYVAFASVFFVLALVCLIQLVMCVVAEYQRMKAPSVLRACHITTQKLLYFLVFLAASIRGAYFTSPAAFQEGWSSSLMSAYYPLLLISYCLLQAAFQEGWSSSLMSAYYPLLLISYCLLQAAFQEGWSSSLMSAYYPLLLISYCLLQAAFQEGWSSSLMSAYYPLLLISYCLLQAAFQEGWSSSLMSAYYPLLLISYCLLQAAFQEGWSSSLMSAYYPLLLISYCLLQAAFQEGWSSSLMSAYYPLLLISYCLLQAAFQEGWSSSLMSAYYPLLLISYCLLQAAFQEGWSSSLMSAYYPLLLISYCLLQAAFQEGWSSSLMSAYYPLLLISYCLLQAAFQEGWSSSLMSAYYPLLLISYCLLQAAFQEGWSSSLMSAYYPLLLISYCLLQAAFQEGWSSSLMSAYYPLLLISYCLLQAAFQEGWSSSLMSAYYPLLLSGSSLIVCFWAEVFHLRDIRWEKPQFLSKSFLGFVVFNIITYSLLLAEFITTQFTYKSAEEKSFYTHVFNGCYAFLLFIVVVFFLIYGVEVFFKVRGGFLSESPVTSIAAGNRTPVSERTHSGPATDKLCESDQTDAYSPLPEQKIDVSQLHQSRFGLLSQALMLMIVVGFLFSETLSEFWKKKVPLNSRNCHDVVFRVVEIGVALWFPCVLWNCMSPEQLWILNPKRILKKLELDSGSAQGSDGRDDAKVDKSLQGGTVIVSNREGDDTDSSGSKDCWICYDSDRQDMGPLIQPCQCRGDVSSVHHDCLRRWLVESAPNPDSLRCKVCNSPYQVQRGEHLDWQHGFTTQHWLQTAAIVTCMCVSAAGAWVTIQLFEDAVIRCLAAGSALLIQYVCVRFLGLHTVVAYQRAKVSALSIVGSHVSTISETVAVDIPKGPQQAHI